MKVMVHVLSAFTKGEKGGNLAGVVLGYEDLTPHQMQKIAETMGFSETAFVQKSEKADFRVRFFTPNTEVDVCGHATIASFALLHQLEMIGHGSYTQETNAGILQIDVTANGVIFMHQNLPSYFGEVPTADICRSLNIKKEDLVEGLPIQIVSTGLKDIMVPIKNREILFSIKPNFEEIKQVSKVNDVIGIHAFTLDTIHDSLVHTRNFAPLYGIEEESATGTSNGALACYLFWHHVLREKEVETIKIEQGHIMEKPSEILVWLLLEKKCIKGVRVGGMATQTYYRELDI